MFGKLLSGLFRKSSDARASQAPRESEKPIIVHKAALEADDPFVPLEMISRFTYALIKERGYAHDEIPQRAFALFVAGKFIFKITEETFASWLENMGPLRPEWLERAADIFEQASLSGHAETLRRLAAWMHQNPGRDPARALAEGDPVLKEIEATARQLAAQVPPAHIWPALLRAVRTWPELLVVDASSEAELMAVVDAHYPRRSSREGQAMDWETTIIRQFTHPAWVAGGLLARARGEVLGSTWTIAHDADGTEIYGLETTEGHRLLVLKPDVAELFEALPADARSMGLERLIRPEDREELQSLMKGMAGSRPRLQPGNRLAGMEMRLVHECIRLAEEHHAPQALILLLRHAFKGEPPVTVMWNWPIAADELESLLQAYRRDKGGLWPILTGKDEPRLHHLFMKDGGAGLVDPDDEFIAIIRPGDMEKFLNRPSMKAQA